MSLQAIRNKKPLDPNRLTGDNAPKTSYVMLGHGSELPGLKIVPRGCILVVNVHSGSLNYIDNELLLKELFNPNNKISLDPIKNYKEIVNVIKKANKHKGSNSLAIYREGDKYPDFEYNLLNFWDSKNDLDIVKKEDSFLLESSGIIRYPFNDINYFHEVKGYDEIDEDIIPKLFKGSKLPFLKSEIKELQDEYKESDIKTIIDYFEGLGNLRIRQSDLFKMVSDGRLMPGVFYNISCRETFTKIRIKNGYNNILDISKYLSNDARPVKGMRREFLEGIREAEFYRAPLIEKLNLNRFEINDIISLIENIDDIEKETRIRRMFNPQLQEYYNDNISECEKDLAYLIAQKEKQDTAMGIKYQMSNNELGQLLKQQLFNNRRAAAEANAAAKVALWRKKGGNYTRKKYKKMSKKRNR